MGQLRDRMEQDLKLRGLSPATIRNYLLYGRKFAAFFMRSPEQLGAAEVRAFLLHQIEVEQLAYASYRQVYAALKFLYSVTLGRPGEVGRLPFPKRRPSGLPKVLTADELTAFFAALRKAKYRALFMTCYAAGLRLGEVCRLQVTDIDSRRMVLHVRAGKGAKERLTILSPRLLEVLRDYWRLAKPRVWLFPGATPARPVALDTARNVPVTAPQRPSVVLDRRQGADAIPLHFKEIIFRIKRRCLRRQHGQRFHAVALRARGLRALAAEDSPCRAAATLCFKASSRRRTVGSAAAVGAGWRARLASTKAASSSAEVSR
jgi:integrase/recombinase XerD